MVPPRVPLSCARLIVAVAVTLAAGFCAAQGRPATDGVPRRVLPPPEVPNPSLVSPLPRTRAGQPAEAPAATPARAEALPPGERAADIVLVLPLQSPDYARAAEAVRDGFLAAAGAAGAKVRVRVIGHADGDVLAAFDSARALGAPVIVGPLVRDDLRALVRSDRPLPPTIALNQLDDDGPLPDTVYTLALAIESDARVLARKARDDGIASIVVIGGDTPLMRRFARAFVSAWRAGGGAAPRSFPFEATPDGLAVLRREVGRSNADGALIAVDGDDAALARTFAPRVPAYASAMVNREQSAAALRDLEDVQIVDVPWLVTPDDPSFADLPRPDLGSTALERLYALGIDSFHVARAFVDGVPGRLELDGATGHLRLGERHAFQREGELAVIRGGRVVAQTVGR